MERWAWIAWVLGIWGIGCEAYGSDVKRLYTRASKAFQSQRWEVAGRDFRRLLPLLERLQKQEAKGSKARALMVLGRCDVLFHLAVIGWKRRRHRASCRLHQRLGVWVSRLPKGWRRWRIHPDVPRRLAASARHLTSRCAGVPSQVVVALKPKAKLWIRESSGKWRPSPPRFSTLAPRLGLKVEAPGYRPKVIKELEIPRWREVWIDVHLEKLPKTPKLRLATPPKPRPRPKPALAFWKTWWFWTATGVVVGGGVALGAWLALRPRTLTFQPMSPQSNGYPLW